MCDGELWTAVIVDMTKIQSTGWYGQEHTETYHGVLLKTGCGATCGRQSWYVIGAE